jgi:hypothetical protein
MNSFLVIYFPSFFFESKNVTRYLLNKICDIGVKKPPQKTKKIK